MKAKTYSFLILLINYYSAFYVIIGVTLPYIYGYSTSDVVYFLLFWIYLLPPLLCRTVITIFSRPVGIVNSHSAVFLKWWFLTQLQIIFVRFPFLEELLRVFPGVYSLWLNLWGAKVSLFTYWSPGVTIIDPYHINIAKGAIIGGGSRIGAHIITVEADGKQTLTLAPVNIEHHSVVGFQASIGPGCRVYANETLPAGKILKPFYAWKDGQIQRPVKAP